MLNWQYRCYIFTQIWIKKQSCKYSIGFPLYSNEKSPSYSDKLVLSSIIPNTLLADLIIVCYKIEKNISLSSSDIVLKKCFALTQLWSFFLIQNIQLKDFYKYLHFH